MDFVKQGKEMRRIRMSLGYTQDQVAERAGISGAHYRKVESGNGCPSVSTLLKICDALETTADVILYPSRAPTYSARLRAKRFFSSYSTCKINQRIFLRKLILSFRR